MWPLSAKFNYYPQNVLCALHGLAGQSSLEGRLKGRKNRFIKRMPLIGGIAKVRSKHQECVPGVVHHSFGHQAQVANPRCVGRDRNLTRIFKG